MYLVVEWENKRFLINEVRLFKPEVSSHFGFQTWIIISAPYLTKILLWLTLPNIFLVLFSQLGYFQLKFTYFLTFQKKFLSTES